MIDHSNMKLGKAAPRRDPRTLMLARYTEQLPAAPIGMDWGTKLSNLGIMLNDRLGNCTCAGIGHIIQVWSSQTGPQVILPDATILALYEQSCGYNPADSNTDQGGVEIDVLNYWKKNPIQGHGLDAFAAIQPGSRQDVMDAIWLFGGCYIGLSLPISAQRQDVWALTDIDSSPGGWGGHAVNICAYDVRGLTCITWGMQKRLTWEFWDKYCDEAYACLSKDWATVTGAPSGFDWTALESDLANL